MNGVTQQEDSGDVIAWPAGLWASDALRMVYQRLGRSLANHSVRSWLFARLLARHEDIGDAVDDDLLFAATVLHDIGLRSDTERPVRFEVDGADFAADFLTQRGLAARDVDLVWEAIALHTSPGIAERRGPLAYLVRSGIGADLGRGTEFVGDHQGALIHDAFPRLSIGHDLVDAIVAQCLKVPERGPRFSAGGELTRERGTPPFRTEMESAVRASRWGE